MREGGEQFLNERYPDLQHSEEVESASKREEVRTGEKPTDKNDKVESYLNRLERLALDSEKTQPRKTFGTESRPRALLLLREMVINKYVRSNKEKMGQGAAAVEERAARELGIQAHYGQEELEQRGEIAVTDLEKSLDNWISYLSDMNEPYPTWFRYYTFRNILNLGDYDKDKGEFTRRSQGSTRLFPDIDRGALAYVEQMIEASKDSSMLEHLQKAQLAAAQDSVPEDQLITQEKAKTFAKFSFAKQYAEAIKQSGEITPEMREETRGNWVKYQQGTDPTALWASLQNKGTPWCTKGFATAETQLKGGDFHVYYTLDKQGRPSIPRLAIRMEGHNKISNDVRGVADSQQNVEGNMLPILDEKLDEFGPEADKFRKKTSDMKRLTEIDKKTKANQQLSADELRFFYEIDGSIKGFGYNRDPRIEDIRKQRNPEEDTLIIIDCKPEQVAHDIKEITTATKAYVGPLQRGIFELAEKYNIEHIYTSLSPEGGIKRQTVEIGGKTKKQLIATLKKSGVLITDQTMHMIDSKDFTTRRKKEQLTLVRIRVDDLGDLRDLDPWCPTATRNIYKKAQELGLELCMMETALHYRRQLTDQPIGDSVNIAMEQIDYSRNLPGVFQFFNNGANILGSSLAGPYQTWKPEDEFIFCVSNPEKTGETSSVLKKRRKNK